MTVSQARQEIKDCQYSIDLLKSLPTFALGDAEVIDAINIHKSRINRLQAALRKVGK